MDTTSALKIPLASPKSLYRNYATNSQTAQRAAELVKPMIQKVRSNRQKMDQLAFRRYNQWCLKTDDRFYLGRSNTYIPAVRRGVERLVTQWLREMFPNDEWWDLKALDKEFERNVDGQKLLMSVQLRDRMRIKRKMRPALRQLALYGISPLKVPWRTTSRTEPQIVVDPLTQRPAVQKTTKVLYDDPDMIPVDFFSFGVYPMTVMDVVDAKLTYEDMVVDLDELKRDTASYANIDKAKSIAGSGSTSEAMQRWSQRLQQLGITEDQLRDSSFGLLTECYTDFDFEDKFQLGPEPAIITLAFETIPIRVQRNPYGQAPYFVMKDAEMIGEFYAHARTEATDRLQITLNDTNNQDSDAAAMANNPAVVVDPNLVEDYQAIAIYPGVKIPAPKEAIMFDRPPDPSYAQKDKISFYMSIISEALGVTASANASPGGATGQSRGARTFGGMQMLQAMYASEAKELVEFQEDAVLEPMLAWIAKLNAIFMADERILKTAGRKGVPVTVNRETFAGDFAYEWLGTATTQMQTVRSAQMLVFANVFGRMPMPPGVTLNVPKMARDWWSSQGLKNASDIVIEMGRVEPIDPMVENQLVQMGRLVEVAPGDNDPEHIAAHLPLRQIPAMLQHIQAHEQAYMMKQNMMRMQMEQAAAGSNGPPRPNGNGARPPGPVPPGMRAGQTPTGTVQSGMGPVRAMAGAPALGGL